ncbi:GNAT family N-acetyltransferase [Anaerosporobacter sp.]
MEVLVTDGTDKRFILLCQKLDECLNDLVGGEKQRVQYVQYNTLQDIHDVVLIMEGDRAVGCGSFKQYDKEKAEIKRVFVNESYRGKRYGRVILKKLEELAKNKGYTKLILETGKPFVNAMHLYQGLGYHVIENYGPYVNMTESVCMEKILN